MIDRKTHVDEIKIRKEEDSDPEIDPETHE
jgi:hypothetical protein